MGPEDEVCSPPGPRHQPPPTLTLPLLLLLLLYALIYAATFLRTSRRLWGNRGWPKGKRVLLAIAHPDDEVMFFGPTITNFLREGSQVYVLCFSYGDAEGLGLVRKAELWASCTALGIPAENVTIIKHDKLKDSQALTWPVGPISLHIKAFVNAYSIDTVVTFDKTGVSGHLNHISVHKAALELVEWGGLPKDCDLYVLKSVGWLRQYILNVFNIPVSYCLNRIVLVAKGTEYRRIVNAMKAHKSQMLWFRHLHVFFSMYLFLNILNLIPKQPQRKPKILGPTQNFYRMPSRKKQC